MDVERGGECIYISNVITDEAIERMLAPRARTLIVSGVGSGKTTFVDKLNDIKPLIMIISRKAKLQEMDEDYVYTNAFVAHHIDDGMIERDFQAIVMDEAHSMMSDQSFAFENSESLEDFFDYNAHMPIIFMTATPEPLYKQRWFAEQNFEVVDVRHQCRNIVPKNITMLGAVDIDGALDNYSRTAVFSQDTKLLRKLYNKSTEDSVILASGLTVESDEAKILSGSTADRILRDIEEREKAMRVYGSIVKNGTIPADIHHIYMTSAFKEGISIFNDNIDAVLVHDHSISNIYQCCGRFRKGVPVLYIALKKPQSVDEDIAERFEIYEQLVQTLQSRRHMQLFAEDMKTYYYFSEMFCEIRERRNTPDSAEFYLSEYTKFVKDQEHMIRHYFGDTPVYSDKYRYVPIVRKNLGFYEMTPEQKRKVIEPLIIKGAEYSPSAWKELTKQFEDAGVRNWEGEPYRDITKLLVSLDYKVKRLSTNNKSKKYNCKTIKTI